MTPADPAAIERILDAARQGVYNPDSIPTLIAAVEALRERNTTLLRKMGERAKWASDATDRAEAAETCVVELAEMLEKVRQCCLFSDDDAGPIGVTTDPHIDEQLFKDICTVLSATPAEAMERAKAVEAVASTALSLSGAMVDAEGKDCDFSPVDEKWSALTAALAKLDTLKA